nr:MAG TPA: hypothetical protein [Caudoviricetes sp.]
MFGLKDYLKEDYFKNSLKVDKHIFEEIREELKKTLFKYNYILDSYNRYNENLEEEIDMLEKEYLELNKVSSLGNQFFLMNSLKEFYNNIITYQIVYNQNLTILDNSVIKNENSLTEIPFNMREENGSLFIYFNDGSHNIQNIFLEFFNDFPISIFGIRENDTLVNIVSNVDNKQKLYINTLKESFKGIFITGFNKISGFLKDCKVYDYKKNQIRKTGVLIYRFSTKEKIKKIFYFSNSSTELYLLNKEEYQEFLKIVNKDILQWNKILNIKNNINKNKEYDNKQGEYFLVEVFGKDVNYSDKINIFGSDK